MRAAGAVKRRIFDRLARNKFICLDGESDQSATAIAKCIRLMNIPILPKARALAVSGIMSLMPVLKNSAKLK
jgi:hypothetical protein